MDLPTASWDQTYIISAHLCKCQVIEIGWIFNMVSLKLSSVLLGQNWGTAFSLLFSSFLSINVSSCPESVIGRWLWLECKAALLLLLMSAPNQGSEWETIWNILKGNVAQLWTWVVTGTVALILPEAGLESRSNSTSKERLWYAEGWSTLQTDSKPRREFLRAESRQKDWTDSRLLLLLLLAFHCGVSPDVFLIFN